MMPPLLSSAANALLETQLRALIRLDPFWQERLAALDGLRLKLILTDSGFRRVFQFGPHDLHLAAPFTDADCTLTTQTLHLSKLLDAQQTEQALQEGHFYLLGNEAAFERITHHLRQWDLDWESRLAEIIPGFAAYQLHAAATLTGRALRQAADGLSASYRFWRDNEHH